MKRPQSITGALTFGVLTIGAFIELSAAAVPTWVAVDGAVVAVVDYASPVAGQPTIGAFPACAEEDGSGVGQAFPCRWDASTSGNGSGRSFILSAPICTSYEIRVADASHARGFDIRLACDDAESVLTYVP